MGIAPLVMVYGRIRTKLRGIEERGSREIMFAPAYTEDTTCETLDSATAARTAIIPDVPDGCPCVEVLGSDSARALIRTAVVRKAQRGEVAALPEPHAPGAGPPDADDPDAMPLWHLRLAQHQCLSQCPQQPAVDDASAVPRLCTLDA